ncbi:MAG: glycosyltransferase family 2 protein, partial [Promethearchaeota archaeon]
IPANDFIEEHTRAYKEHNIFGLRGKAIPITHSFYNYLAGLYDLGDEVISCPICLEGNSSFKREVLIEIGGFNPELQGAGGHEGLELSYRFFVKYKDKSKLVYYPKAIIYHDGANNFYKYIKKTLRSTRHSELISARFPRIWEFYGEYDLKPKKITVPNFIDRIKLKILLKFTAVILRSRRIIIKIFE